MQPSDDPGHTVAPGPAGGAKHAARPAANTRRLVAAVVGAAALLAAIGIGTAALLRSSGTAPSVRVSANTITVTPTVPLSDRDVVALIGRSPVFGPLADPKRRAACLSALGYPGSLQVLGAEPLHVDGRAAIVLVLPGEHPDEVVAVAVAPNCSAVDTGLIADTTVRRP
ncbi:MAG TPA: hypothetical protein VMD51_11135 [Mycobacterium sp.]|nr:hypothetical protein [Mycobacterium sp.]